MKRSCRQIARRRTDLCQEASWSKEIFKARKGTPFNVIGWSTSESEAVSPKQRNTSSVECAKRQLTSVCQDRDQSQNLAVREQQPDAHAVAVPSFAAKVVNASGILNDDSDLSDLTAEERNFNSRAKPGGVEDAESAIGIATESRPVRCLSSSSHHVWYSCHSTSGSNSQRDTDSESNDEN